MSIRSSSVLLPTLAAVLCSSVAAAGDAVASLHCRSAAGNPSVGVRPGDPFVVSVDLESDIPISYNSAIFRLVLSRAGVVVEDYEWTPPFVTRGPFDFSLLGMQLPEAVDADTLSGPTYPVGVIDVEFASFLAVGEAGEGTVVEVELRMPSDIEPGESFQVVAVPDTFAFGFVTIPTAAATVLTVRATASPDFDGNGGVDGVDLTTLLAKWGTAQGDFNGDGQTNGEDLAILLAGWS